MLGQRPARQARQTCILISRSGCTASKALARLQTLSQTEHRKLGDVAQRIPDEATRRARARHHGRT